MSWVVWRTELGELHVIPDGEDHSYTDQCWCKPISGGGAFVHNSADRREHTVEKQ